jgi:hypothetical protein
LILLTTGPASLPFREAAIHEQFRSRDVTAVVEAMLPSRAPMRFVAILGMLVLFTTPVIYLAFEQAQLWVRGQREQAVSSVEVAVPAA